jgi:hypothetical protein
MSDTRPLIPPPREIRERLASNIREQRLLRALLRLSERAAAEERPVRFPFPTSNENKDRP